jgi:hypothetical protein
VTDRFVGPARLPMKGMHQIPISPRQTAHVTVSALIMQLVWSLSEAWTGGTYQLRLLHTPVPRRCSDVEGRGLRDHREATEPSSSLLQNGININITTETSNISFES